MKTPIRLIALVAGIVASQLCMAQAPAGAPAGATGLCNDGTYYTGATKQGACRGHKGVKDWYGATAATPAKTPAAAAAATPAAAPAPAPAAKTKADTAAPAAGGMAQAPTGAPAGATGLCNDGTYYTGATKQGACRGHKGVKDWYGATAATPAKTPAAATPAAAPAPAPAAKTKADTAAPAAGGGAGQVWLNTATNVYHCPGTQYYGKTKAGAYMTEAEAKAKGAHAARGKACN